jgi:hypothetical protein
MKRLRTALVAVQIVVSTLGIGYAGQPAAQEAPVGAVPDGVDAKAIQDTFDTFTRAILDGDENAFAGVVSEEVLARSANRGIKISKLLRKQRKAIALTFGLAEGVRPRFEVDEILVQGDVARVTVRFRGEELKKPFYFVREGDGFKLNILPPGFSQAPPPEALFGSSNYQVHNKDIYGNQAFTLRCYRGSGVADGVLTVPANSIRSISCKDACGWFSGSIFQDYYGYNPARKCDWNWWGDDVIIDHLYGGYSGWYCNDNC